MNERKVFCGGKEYDLGYAHGCYYNRTFGPERAFTNSIAYLAGYLAGANVRLGNSWTVATHNDIVIHRLTEVPETARKQSRQTLRLIDIEIGSDQQVEAYFLDSGSLLVVAGPGAIVGIPAGIWEISINNRNIASELGPQ